MKMCERGILSGEVSRRGRAFLSAATHHAALFFLVCYDFVFRKNLQRRSIASSVLEEPIGIL